MILKSANFNTVTAKVCNTVLVNIAHTFKNSFNKTKLIMHTKKNLNDSQRSTRGLFCPNRTVCSQALLSKFTTEPFGS